MNNIIKSFALAILLLPTVGVAQTMSWVPSSFLMQKACYDGTNCNENVVCYTLQYTPTETGVMTSYTTGFFASCDNRVVKITKNESCSMVDNSREVNGCKEYGKMLINCSGNTGTNEVVAGRTMVLHQVCFELGTGTGDVTISKDATTNLTVGLDLENSSRAITEYPEYLMLKIENEKFCQSFKGNLQLTAESETYKESILRWSPAKEEEGIPGIYEIMRSGDKKNFELIASIESNTLKQGQLQYEYIDEEAKEGNNFYRIKFVSGARDLDSNVDMQYFNSEKSVLEVYPNPANEILNINVTTNTRNSQIDIYNSSEILVWSQNVKSFESKTLNISDFPQGMYTAKVIDGDQVLVKKFVIVHN